MKLINRDDIENEAYREILDAESHHDHDIHEDNGIIRWVEDRTVRELVDIIGMNHLWEMFYKNGYTENSEFVRKIYRDIGYSLCGYWEVFYWELNNDISDDYVGGKLK